MSQLAGKIDQNISHDSDNESKTEDATVTDSDLSPNGGKSKELTNLTFSLRIWRVTAITAISLFAVSVVILLSLHNHHRNNNSADVVPEENEEMHQSHV